HRRAGCAGRVSHLRRDDGELSRGRPAGAGPRPGAPLRPEHHRRLHGLGDDDPGAARAGEGRARPARRQAMSARRVHRGAALAAALLALLPAAAHAQKKTLTVALNQDPDILDPTLARTYVGRIVFAHLCEKLYEIDEQLRIHPQLAADLPAIGDGGRTV